MHNGDGATIAANDNWRSDNEAEIIRVLDAGADDYVIKPFDPDDVVDAVRRLADQDQVS